MYYEPTPHQIEDSDAMLEYADALLWADAGTGKTVTAMEAIRKGGFEKVIVICPKLAVSMWKEELEKHLGIVVKAKTSGSFAKGEGLHYADALVTTFGIARSWFFKKDKALSKVFSDFRCGGVNAHKNKDTWRGYENGYKTVVIIDEAHNLKSIDAKQTMAVFGDLLVYGPNHIKTPFDCVVSPAHSVWQLTGTPVTRYYDDLYTQLKSARPEILTHFGVDTYKKFVDKFCKTKFVRDGYGKHRKVVCGNTNYALLERLLEACCVIRRTLDEVVADLPPITHRIVDVDYKNVPNISVKDLDNLIRELNNPDSEMAKIRHLLGNAKVPGVVEYIKEYGRRPLLLGVWHTDVGDAYYDALSKVFNTVVTVRGSTPDTERDLIRERFNNGQIDCIVGQMQAMNTSWNIQEACEHVIIAEELPSPAMLHQFYSRVYRRGQKRHVQVDHMLSTHSLDVGLRNIRLRKGADNKRIGL
jgi:SNF2 family DNA or RNA helicase